MPGSFALGQVKMVCGLVEMKNVCAETSFEIQIRTFSVHYAVKSLDKICWFIIWKLDLRILRKLRIFWLHDIQPGYTYILIMCLLSPWSYTSLVTWLYGRDMIMDVVAMEIDELSAKIT